VNPLQTRRLTRQQIGSFVSSDRGVRAFEAVQEDITNQYDALTTASFLTLTTEPTLGAERVLTPTSGELVGTDDGANSTYTLGLADTSVTPNTYGDATKTLSFTVDQKGRVTDVQEFGLDTDNIAEGATNLYFTQARARTSLSDGNGITYDNTTGVISVTSAGTYGTPTGTLSRTTFATYTAPTISSPPTQAEVQAIAGALQIVSRTLAALITDMEANGNLT